MLLKKEIMMKQTKLAAISLTALLAIGCGSSSNSGSDDPDTGTTDPETGITDPVVGNAIKLVDALDTTPGSVIHALASPSETGAVSVNVFYPTGQTQTGYLTLFNADGDIVGELKLDDKGTAVTIKRNIDLTAKTTEVLADTFNQGEWAVLKLTWNATTYEAFLNDVSIGSWDVLNAAPVSLIQSKIGSISKFNDPTVGFYVDDLMIYSDTAASTAIVEMNFDDLVDGDDVAAIDEFADTSTENITIQATISDEQNGTVVDDSDPVEDTDPVEGTDPVEDTDPVEETSLQVAAITDTLDSDTGELRYSVNTLNTGQVNVSLLYDASETESAYVTLYDTAGSTKSSIADLKLDEGKISLRDVDGTLATFTPGEWVDIQLTWDTSSTTEAATISLSVNGELIGDDYPSSYDVISGSVNAAAVETVSVRYLSNSATTTLNLYADDLSIFSDVAGTSSVFADDFESYAIGTLLDSSVDGVEDTDYHKNSSEATVAAEPEL